jgi:hypothetical protein
MFDHERVTVTVGVPEAGGLCKCCLGLGSFHFCFQPTTTTIIITPSAAPPPPSPKMSSVEQIEAELELVQRLEQVRKKKEEEERAAAEEAWRVREATEWKAREEAEATAKEEKAKAAERMAEAERKQHALAAVATAEWKWKLEQLAMHQRRIAEKWAEQPIASGSGLLPSEMRKYKRQAAVGCMEVSGFRCFPSFDLCFFFRHRKRKMPTGLHVSGAGRRAMRAFGMGLATHATSA